MTNTLTTTRPVPTAVPAVGRTSLRDRVRARRAHRAAVAAGIAAYPATRGVAVVVLPR